jgi:hypothetical protein
MNPILAGWSATILMSSNKTTPYEMDTRNGVARRAMMLRLPLQFVNNPYPRKSEKHEDHNLAGK